MGDPTISYATAGIDLRVIDLLTMIRWRPHEVDSLTTLL
jgi:hypothetical protein